jgi:hypothetical protein
MDERVKEVEAKLELLRTIRDEKKAQYFKVLSPVEKEKAKFNLQKNK